MNRIHRVVFNRARGDMQVVPEFVRTHAGKSVSKPGSITDAPPVIETASWCIRRSRMATAIFLFGLSSWAWGAQTVLTPGQDIYANGLSLGKYDLLLGGNVTWNTGFTNGAASSTIAIDGAGYTINMSSNNGQRFVDTLQNNSTISMTNATVTAPAFVNGRYGMFRIIGGNVTANLNLDGTTFLNVGPTNFTAYDSADYGPLINLRAAAGGVLNVSGGANGVVFKGNHALADSPGAIGIYGQNTMNFSGPVTFDSNYTANYGGAMAIYEAANSAATFQGPVTFKGNHADTLGGAIEFWGGAANLTTNGTAAFDGNFVYNTPTSSMLFPYHGNQQSFGGAINIGAWNPGAPGINLVFNGATTFSNNFVNDLIAGHTVAVGSYDYALSNDANSLYAS